MTRAELEEGEHSTAQPFLDAADRQISNACGSIGLLHALLNLPEGSLEPNSKLVQFKVQSKDLDRKLLQPLLLS